MSKVLLIHGDARKIPLRDGSAHCCITSPPYWGLRSYGIGGTQGELGCESLHDCAGAFTGCPCGECYVCHLVQAFREVWRVLRDNGCVFLNLGDSYAANRSYQVPDSKWVDVGNCKSSSIPPGLKPKDLVGIPWRVALALQADGWTLRNDCVWEKPSCMPESVRDRFTKSHEYVFLLTKQARYFFDSDAVREDYSAKGLNDAAHTYGWNAGSKMHRAIMNGIYGAGGVGDPTMTRDAFYQHGGRNARTVWRIPSEGYAGAHYATMPTALVERCIKAGTSQMGSCPACSAPWVRVVEHGPPDKTTTRGQQAWTSVTGQRDSAGGLPRRITQTTGWAPSCSCDAGTPLPCLVADPFSGASTTVLVARQLGRHGIGIDLSWDYLQISRERLGLQALKEWDGGRKATQENYADLPLFGGGHA